MKKDQFLHVRARTVLFLSIITFAVYSVVWLALQRSRLASKPPKMTHWGYALGAVWLMLLGGIAFYELPQYFTDDLHHAAFVATVGLSSVTMVATLFLTVWAVRILAAINKELKVEVSPVLLGVGVFFLAPLALAYEQSIINRKGAMRARQVELLNRMTTVAVIVGSLLLIAEFTLYPLSQMTAETEKYYEARKLDGQLYHEYMTCTDDLERKYPEKEIPDEIYNEYSKEFDACEEIYQEYLKPKY